MSIFVQDGWGKSDKIDHGIQDGSVSGVIWSPRDEDPLTLPNTISQYKASYANAQMLFDPQFYTATVANPRIGRLPDYPYYPGGLTRASFTDPQNIQKYVKETLDYQFTLDLDRIISPTVLFEDFRDPWSQVALMMASASVSYHSTMSSVPPLLISLVASESALTSTGDLEEFLDALSLLQTTGVYLIIQRSTQIYQSAFEPTPLENLLYMVYALADVNQFELVLGYCDFVGILMQAAGAKATCSGWYNNLRQFTMDRFRQSEGGRQPRPRYSSLPLLNSIFVDEMDNINYIGQISTILSNTTYDSIFNTSSSPSSVSSSWSLAVSTLHHWSVLFNLTNPFQGMTVQQRLSQCMNLIDTADTIYGTLIQNGITFDPTSNNRHLRQWRQALTNFRTRAGI